MSAIVTTCDTQAQAPSQAPSSRFYRPELDALRFVAFLAVFFLHGVAFSPDGILKAHPVLVETITTLRSMGRFGLSLFFLLSSFLITTLLLLERQKIGAVHLRNFYTRRALRIWPLYYAYLFGAYVLGLLWEPAHFSSAALFCYSFLSSNWYVVALSGKIVTTVGPLWSIAVEEQFYLVWPSLVRKMSPKSVGIFSLLLCTISLIGVYVLAKTGSTPVKIWFNSVSEAIFFAIGALLALRLGLREQQKSLPKAVGGIALCLSAWYGAVRLGFTYEGVAPHIWPLVYALAAAGAASLLWAFLHLPRMLIRREFVYLGRISYGLYVFHGLLLMTGEHVLLDHFHLRHTWIPIAFTLTIACAAASYEFFEKPFLRLKHRFELVHSRTA